MTPIQFIRKNVFQAKQIEFAAIAGVGQATVSRWENGGAPSQAEMTAIRNEAIKRGLPWQDSYFFDAPAAVGART